MRRPIAMITPRLLPLIGVVALATTACGGHVADAGSGSGAAQVLVAGPQDDGMDALAGGRLARVGRCLGIDDYVVVWADGTEVVDDTPLTIELPDGSRHTVGDRVRIGGGFVVEHSGDQDAPDPLEVGGVEVPRSCAAYDVFLASGD